jgi:hypothetical protein
MVYKHSKWAKKKKNAAEATAGSKSPATQQQTKKKHA